MTSVDEGLLRKILKEGGDFLGVRGGGRDFEMEREGKDRKSSHNESDNSGWKMEDVEGTKHRQKPHTRYNGLTTSTIRTAKEIRWTSYDVLSRFSLYHTTITEVGVSVVEGVWIVVRMEATDKI